MIFVSYAFTNASFPSLYIYADDIVKNEFHEVTFKFENFDGFNYYGGDSIRIRGNSTALADKKSYNIKLDNKYNIFGFEKSKKWTLLANHYDPTLIRNKLIFDLAYKLNFEYSPRSTFVDVWLNDTFVGNYQFTSKVEFAKTRLNYDTENGDFLFERDEIRNKNDVTYFLSPVDSFRFALEEPEAFEEGQKDLLMQKLTTIENAINTLDIYKYAPYVDLRSIIDQYWIEEFVAQPDLHTGSRYFFIHDNTLHGGPVWDYDLALGNTKSSAKAKGNSIFARQIWLKTLFKDPRFKKLADERFLELVPYFENLAQDNELGKNQIDSLFEIFGDSFLRNFSDSGWTFKSTIGNYNSQAFTTYEKNVDTLRSWILNRLDYLNTYIKKELEPLDSIDITWEKVDARVKFFKDSLTTALPPNHQDNNSLKANPLYLWQQGSRLLSKNRSITLNVPEGEKYTVIDHLGRKLQQGQTTSNTLSLSFKRSGLYIVKINKYYFSVIVR